MTGLRKELTSLRSGEASKSSDLQRSNLRLEGLQASHATLEAKYDELQKLNADLHQQVEKWMKLESRDTGELEAVRKRKIELEVSMEELQSRLDEAEKMAGQQEEKTKARVEKYKVDVNKYKTAYLEHQVRVFTYITTFLACLTPSFSYRQQALEEANNDIEQLQAETEDYKAQLHVATLKFAKLQEDFAEARRSSRKSEVCTFMLACYRRCVQYIHLHQILWYVVHNISHWTTFSDSRRCIRSRSRRRYRELPSTCNHPAT